MGCARPCPLGRRPLSLPLTHLASPSLASLILSRWQAVEGSKPRLAGERMAGSYANFYVANGVVVMPAFGGAAAEADAR